MRVRSQINAAGRFAIVVDPGNGRTHDVVSRSSKRALDVAAHRLACALAARENALVIPRAKWIAMLCDVDEIRDELRALRGTSDAAGTLTDRGDG